MSRLFFLAVFLASVGFIVREKLRLSSPPPAPPRPAAPAPLPPPPPVLSEPEMQQIRASLRDSDPEVRWAAAQLLFSVRDPRLAESLEQLVAEDPDPGVRRRVMGLMKDAEKYARLKSLVKGLDDPDKTVRAAALETIGETGDPSVLVWVTRMLKDPEPEVRVAALRALGRFEDRRKAEFQALAEKLKSDYEEAVKRAAARR